MRVSVSTFHATDAKTIVAVADCHIHPSGGVTWTDDALNAFMGADLIITLGDIGEAIGLEVLAKIAPLVGVRGADDADDSRIGVKTRVLEVQGVRIGCMFDPVESGLAKMKDPLTGLSNAAGADAFGGPVDVLLWASTHKPSVERADDQLRVNPGSPTLPDGGAARTFARLTFADGSVDARIIAI
jgi:putative phosphoesterase